MASDIIVFDFETTHITSTSKLCDPIELAACVIDGRYLRVKDNSEFSIIIRPDNIEDEDYYEKHKSTMDWHCKKDKCKPEDLIKKWAAGIPEKQAWNQFADFCRSYNWAKKSTTACIPAGTNIRNFDLNIVNRLNKKHKVTNFFHKRDRVDIQDLALYWFMFSQDRPRSFSMDNLRQFFNMTATGAHSALQDIRQETEIILKFLRQFKKYGPGIDFTK